MISVVDLLLQAEQYNGHLQTILTKVRYNDLVEIMIELESIFGKSCYLEVDGVGGGSVYIKDFWKPNENGHHIDRLILSVDDIVYDSLGRYL